MWLFNVRNKPVEETHIAANHKDERRPDVPHSLAWHALGEFTLRGASDDERQATAWVAETVRELGMSPAQFERIRTAMAEAVLNAMKQGHRAVSIRVLTSAAQPAGQERNGQPTPQGWGLFLLQKDAAHGREAKVANEGAHHIIELFLYPEGGKDRATDSEGEQDQMKRLLSGSLMLLLAVMLLAGIFLALSFKAAFSTTTDNTRVSTIGSGEGYVEGPPLVIFVQAPDNLTEPLRRALFNRVGTLTVGTLTPFSTMALTETPASDPGSAALVVIVDRRTYIWTPVYATANLSVRIAFASDGRVDWNQLGAIDTVMQASPGVRMSGDLEIRDRSFGLISLPGYWNHIAGQISDKVVESINSSYQFHSFSLPAE